MDLLGQLKGPDLSYIWPSAVTFVYQSLTQSHDIKAWHCVGVGCTSCWGCRLVSWQSVFVKMLSKHVVETVCRGQF